MTLQIEAGKFYRRRDGVIVGPMERTEDFDVGWDWSYVGCDSAYWIDGHFNYDGKPCPEDLVAEWDRNGRPAYLIIDEIGSLLSELRKVTL